MNGCIRLLLDQIFGRKNFRQEFIVPRPTDIRHGPNVAGHDTVFFFSSGPDFVYNAQSRPLAPDQIATFFKSTDERGPYRYVNLTSPIKRDSMAFEWHGAIPPTGHSWRFTAERMDEFFRDGRIDVGSPGAGPRLKRYLTEREGDDVGTVWSDLSLRLSANEGLSFPTQKPEGLVERIVRMGSNEGDVVLDPYCGSGTALVVCQRTARRWIGGDIEANAVTTTKTRLRAECGLESNRDFASWDEDVLRGLGPANSISPVTLTTGFDDLNGPARSAFVLGERVAFDETRLIELKEVKGSDPIGAVANAADEYAVAFLNSEGGSIFWGIRDSDHVAVGVSLSAPQRDKIRQTVNNKLHAIQPPIDPSRFHLELHSLDSAGAGGQDLFIVELSVPQVKQGDPFYTGGGDAFVRVDGVKKKLAGPQLTDWIRQRTMATSINAQEVAGPRVVALVGRIRRIFLEHELEPAHLARFLKVCHAPFTLALTEFQNDGVFLAWLTEEKIDWIAKTFLVRREWIDGEGEEVHERYCFDKQPKLFFETVSQHVDSLVWEEIHNTPEAYFIRWSQKGKWLSTRGSEVFVVIRVPLARISNERTIWKYISDFSGYSWDYGRTHVQLRAWARLLSVSKGITCIGREMPYEVGEALEADKLFLHDMIERKLLRTKDDWHPDDYAFSSSESRAAKDVDTFPHVIEFLRRHDLPFEEKPLFPADRPRS